MSDKQTCDNCGSTSFYESNGLNFCSDCQQQVHTENTTFLYTDYRQLDNNEDIGNKKAIVNDKTASGHRKRKIETEIKEKLTSFECYNYIVCGLVRELIALGADPVLKKTVRLLWFKYLRKIEVLQNKGDALPKLGAAFWRSDAEILYGHKKKEWVRKSRAKTMDDIDKLHSGKQALYRFKSKKMRKVADNLDVDEADISVEKSLADVEYKKSGETQESENYDFSTSGCLFTERLSRTRVFSIIYLGLIINNDKIQLGDIMRFIREGHLSFHQIYHFFPSQIDREDANIHSYKQRLMSFTHHSMRWHVLNLAKFLDVTHYIPCQNLVDMCQRYCVELNVPEEVSRYAINLIIQYKPQMRIFDTTTEIPNYEGRVLSIIIFIFKLLFGLDDRTEEEMSKYAILINGCRTIDDPRMFVWRDWVHHVHYRKLVLSQHHFPTQYLFSNEDVYNVSLFNDFMRKYNEKYMIQNKKNTRNDMLKQVLVNQKQKEEELRPGNVRSFTFESTFTPFRDYTLGMVQQKIANKQNKYLKKDLKRNFDQDSLRFLVNSEEYIGKVASVADVKAKKRSAVRNLTLTDISDFSDKRSVRCGSNVLNVSFEEDEIEEDSEREVELNSPVYELENSNDYDNIKTKYVHYKPYCKYWLKTMKNQKWTMKDHTNKFFNSFPESFKFLVNECARISEQEPYKLLGEFLNTELFFMSMGMFENESILQNNSYKLLIKRAKQNW